MLPVVARQLVGACELPAAALPVAVVWLLPCGGNTHAPVRGKKKKELVGWWGGWGGGKGGEVPPVLQPLQPRGPEPQQGSVSTCSPTLYIHHPPLCDSIQSPERRIRTCVCAVMRFEVRALGVGFPTADVVARVRGHPLPRPGAPTPFRLGLLRRAVPAGDHEGLCGMESPQSSTEGNARCRDGV